MTTGEDLNAAARAAALRLTPLRISEVVLKTARFDDMKRWYSFVLGVEPFFERKPSPEALVDARTRALGRASDRRICFIRLFLAHPYNQVLGLFEVPDVTPQPGEAPGLDHIQLRNPSMDELIARHDLLQSIGVEPFRTANHGPGTSFYYRDPDGNRVELSASNFDTEADYLAYFGSAAYAANPSGIEIDAADFVGKFKAGVPKAQLVAIPTS